MRNTIDLPGRSRINMFVEGVERIDTKTARIATSFVLGAAVLAFEPGTRDIVRIRLTGYYVARDLRAEETVHNVALAVHNLLLWPLF